MKPNHQTAQAFVLILVAAMLLSSCVRPASKAPPASPVPASGSLNITPTFPLPGSGSLATPASGQAAEVQGTEIPGQAQPAPATETATATAAPGMNVYFPLIFNKAEGTTQ